MPSNGEPMALPGELRRLRGWHLRGRCTRIQRRLLHWAQPQCLELFRNGRYYSHTESAKALVFRLSRAHQSRLSASYRAPNHIRHHFPSIQLDTHPTLLMPGGSDQFSQVLAYTATANTQVQIQKPSGPRVSISLLLLARGGWRREPIPRTGLVMRHRGSISFAYCRKQTRARHPQI